jgi:hypothetical protein
MCGFTNQTTKHLFFNSPLVDQFWDNLLTDLRLLPSLNSFYNMLTNLDDKLQVLLNGNDNLPRVLNFGISERVSQFISEINTILPIFCGHNIPRPATCLIDQLFINQLTICKPVTL